MLYAESLNLMLVFFRVLTDGIELQLLNIHSGKMGITLQGTKHVPTSSAGVTLHYTIHVSPWVSFVQYIITLSGQIKGNTRCSIINICYQPTSLHVSVGQRK